MYNSNVSNYINKTNCFQLIIRIICCYEKPYKFFKLYQLGLHILPSLSPIIDSTKHKLQVKLLIGIEYAPPYRSD